MTVSVRTLTNIVAELFGKAHTGSKNGWGC